MDTANQTFGIFFKHFACFNVSEQLGGYVYAKPTLDHRTGDWIGAYGGPVNATLNTPVDELRMSPTAAILSMSILVFLMIVTIIIYATNRNEYKAIPRDVDTLASTIGWVYASDRLLAWTAVAPPIEPHLLSRRAPSTMAHKARMGPFRDSAGNEHWGIEIVDTDTDDLKGNGKEDNASQATVSAGELIELQTRKRLNTRQQRGSVSGYSREVAGILLILKPMQLMAQTISPRGSNTAKGSENDRSDWKIAWLQSKQGPLRLM